MSLVVRLRLLRLVPRRLLLLRLRLVPRLLLLLRIHAWTWQVFENQTHCYFILCHILSLTDHKV